MVPAQQGLAADGAAGSRIDDRLIGQFHLAVLQRELQIMFELYAPVVTLGDREGVADDLPASGLFGFIKREVGIAKQLFQRRAVPRRDGIADAGAAYMLVDADQERIGKRREDLLGRDAGPVFVGADDDHHEFVAADSGDFVARPHDGFDPVADFLEHGIAGLMAERVVDVLEAIEVDQDQRDDSRRNSATPERRFSRSSISAVRFHRSVSASRRAISSILGERGMTGNDILEHRPADDDDAEIGARR